LGLEGSGFAVSAGLCKEGTPVSLAFTNSGIQTSEIILETIESLFSRSGVNKEDLRGICVSLGPGSFTSLRVSLATVEALALGLDIPVYGVDLLRLMAASSLYFDGTVKVIQKAYKGEMYYGCYRTRSGKVAEVKPIDLIDPKEFIEELEKGDLIMGTGLELIKSQQEEMREKGVLWREDFRTQVSGLDVIEYFLDQPEKPSQGAPLEPIYIKLSEAEINFDKRAGR